MQSTFSCPVFQCGVPGWWCVGSVLSRGFCWLSRARASAFFIRTHSQRETWALLFPRPTGSLTARVLGDSGSAPPRVSTPSLSFELRQSSPGTARPFPHRLVSAEPRALAATRPLGHSPANAQTKSLALTPFGHTLSG